MDGWCYIALAIALKKLKKMKIIDVFPISDYMAAISVGIVDGKGMLDLAYTEDSQATVDMNVVMTGRGDLIELQGTAEGKPLRWQKMG